MSMLQSESIPILKLKDFLVVSIQMDLHDRMAEQASIEEEPEEDVDDSTAD